MTATKRTVDETAEVGKLSQPTILIVGDNPTAEAVATALEKLNATLRRTEWSTNTKFEFQAPVTAGVLVPPLRMTSTVRAIRTIRQHRAVKDIPLFAVLSKASKEREIRNLYAEGISAVFEWPSEADVLPYCLAEMIAAAFVRGRATHPNRALARAIRAQIRTRCDFNHRVRVRVEDETAVLNGSVSHLWQKQRIKEVALSVPGLRGVIDRDVFVLPTGVSDKEISERIRRMMNDVSEIDEETIAVRVENGYVTLAGSVENRVEAKRLTRLISNIKGVRDISLLTVISPSQKRYDSRTAKALQTLIERLFLGEDAKVSFFGNTAVLSGSASSLFTKQRIAQVLEDEDAVDRVVNKLNILQSEYL